MLASSFLTGRPSIQEIHTKIESLNHEISVIQAEIRCLKEHKNTHLLTVSKVPTDILSIMFEALTLDATFPSAPKPQEAYAHLLPATQVCRLWRAVALDSPCLWGCIFAFAPPRIVRLFLDRAASAPLYLRGSGGFNEESVLAVLNHLDRLKEITLQGAMRTRGSGASHWSQHRNSRFFRSKILQTPLRICSSSPQMVTRFRHYNICPCLVIPSKRARRQL